MKTHFTFTVLRYIHDPVSGEFANVGVVLYAPELRFLDAICTPDGRVVPGEFFPSIFNETPGVLQFRAHQRSLELLEISVVANGEFDSIAQRLCREKIQRVFGSAIGIAIQRVDQLPPSSNGKLRVTTSELG